MCAGFRTGQKTLFRHLAGGHPPDGHFPVEVPMSSIPADYLEKLYAGFTGKNIGIRLGAPVEPAIWTYERIRDIYGDIRGYIKPYKNFAADDDANGPVFFAHAQLDKEVQNGRLTRASAADVERAWLEYARDGVGMFWWGGYGRSTEHTAYLNLKHGIHAPESGSIERNGKVVAEQIGGQIFIDTWGLLYPGRPDEAAEAAAVAASVSHDGEALNGARFIASCIAEAFVEKDINRIFSDRLAALPADSYYASVLRAVQKFHASEPEDFRPCMEMLLADWGYDRWPGLCHVIPNAGVCALALLYGSGDFARTVETAAMCGWDTDCNAGNVGTIAGVLAGIEGIPERYRAPVNDAIVLSGIAGSLNVLDIPSFSKRVAAAGYALAGEKLPGNLAAYASGTDGLHFDFGLPGSTHGFRTDNPNIFSVVHRDRNGRGCLEFRFDRLERGVQGRLFYKPYYRRADFDDERYSPVFSPLARPGMKARISFECERWEGDKISVQAYVRDSFDGKDILVGNEIFPENGSRSVVEFVLPDVGGSEIDEVGIIVTGFSGGRRRDSGRLFIESFDLDGKARYSIDMAKQSVEFGAVRPFSHDGEGAFSLDNGRMQLMSYGPCFSYTGGHAVQNQRISAELLPLAGGSHLLGLRCRGAASGYFAGLDQNGKAAIFKRDIGFELLASCSFDWKAGKTYKAAFSAEEDRLELFIDGNRILSCKDGRWTSGMQACGSITASRCLYGQFQIEEL